jgi:hypothetical protein
MVYNNDYHTYQFCDGSNWYSIKGGGGASPMILISTQTASASASLQFTNLPTSYNTLFLDCKGVISATNSAYLTLQYGEGAGPTWETANYSYTENYTTSNGVGPGNSASASTSSIPITISANNTNSADTFETKAWIYNNSSSSLYKVVSYLGAGWVDSGGSPVIGGYSGGGSYSGDTNAITAFRLQMNSGNITSGTCSLYGMN